MKKGGKGGKADPDDVQVVARNKRAVFDYDIEERVEAGLVLTGSEVKSLREQLEKVQQAHEKLADRLVKLEADRSPRPRRTS